MKRLFFLIIVFLIINIISFAQIDSLVNPVNKGLKLKIGKNTNSFAKFGFHTQLWTRASEFNTGISDYQGNKIEYDIDFIMRRTAFTSLIVIDKFKFFTNLTVTSQSNTSAVSPYAKSSPKLYFYDIWASYNLFKNYLTLGGGLHMYNGISRYTSASSMKSLGADVPLIAAPNLLTTDQSARQMGVFATGNIKSLAYRLAINKPFVTSTIPSDTLANTIYHQPTNNLSYSGYFEYHFFDKESNFMPFKSGTYFGKKKILNLGAGFYSHADGTMNYKMDSTTQQNNISHFAIDLFCELPLTNNSAITFYGAKFWLNYGKNYLHAFGVQESFKGSLAEFQFGTGDAYFFQTAYLLPSNKETKRLQPFYELCIRDFEAMNQVQYHHNIGLNYLVIHHHLKVTLQYENRPFLQGNSVERKSMLIGKFQFSL